MADANVTKVSSTSAFHTRARSNEGIEVPLYLPTGEKSDKWIRIRGAESDAAREAFAEMKRAVLAIKGIEDTKVQAEALRVEDRKLTAALVVDWNLDEPCTEENILALLKEAPQIERQIDAVSENRTLFFGAKLSSSPSTPKQSSDSTSDPKEAKPVTEPT
jgi:hypothetical protein